MNSRTTKQWQEADAAHFMHPFTDHAGLASRGGARIVERAEGIYIWDTEGRKILDGMSGLWCVNVGYGQQSLIDAAASQMARLPFYNTFFDSATPPTIELAELLAEVTPQQFRHVFFTNSGSEAIDTVVRMVRRYWHILGQPQRQVVIGRWNGFHGSTMAGASLGGMKGMHEQGGLPIPGIVHVEQPFWYESGRGLSCEAFGLQAARALEARILEVGADRIAAFVGEPVQGAGGVIVPPSTYWPEIQRICDQYGILLVSDEVICGFGRTGNWFGCETFGTRPDLMTFAKGVTSGYVPLGGVMVGKRVADVLLGRGGEFQHGHTYSGHPVACAVGVANLTLLRERGLVGYVRGEIGPHFAKRLEELRDHPLVGDVQTCGLMGAIHLVPDKSAGRPFPGGYLLGTACRTHCFDNGLVLRAVGDRMIVAPPLVITPAQVDELAARARKCLDLTLAEARARGWC